MDNNYNNENELNNTVNNNNTGKGGNFLVGMVIGFLCAVLLASVVAVVFLVPVIKQASHTQILEQNYETSDDFIDSVMQKIKVIQACLDNDYYYEQNYEDAADAIYSAYMAGIGDDYAYYYDKEELEALTQETTGTYSGIGAVVSQDLETGYILIVNPYETGPAFEAGIRKNDYIKTIDGVDVKGMDLNTAVTYMKGEEGTDVEVGIIRDGEELTFTITRRVIEIQTVEYKMLEDDIGYVAVSSFEGKTAEHFKEAIDSLMDDGAEGIVVDLRDNGGGLLNSVVEMLDYLLPEGVLVYTEDNQGNKVYERSDDSCVDIPMAVLINGNSASASEVFTGAMQDYEAAVIVGETSFGKGIVQTVRPLGDGTAIKYTTDVYYTPEGRNIHGTGIEPDVEVSLPEDEEAYENGVLKEEYDTQLEAAIEELTK